jgi:tetratricopeptide (TPR) repeat protein
LDTYRLLGEAALGMGDLHAAREWSEKAQGLILTFSSEVDELSAVQRGELRRFRGMLALQEGDWERAGKYLLESEAIFMKLRSRWYQGRIAYQLGALAQAQGDRRSARLRYREAAMLFQSIGAKLEARRTEEAYNLQIA